MQHHSKIALVAAVSLLAMPGVAEAKAKHHTRHHAVKAENGPTTAEQLRLAQEQISQLQAQLNSLQTKVEQQSEQANAGASSAVAAASQAASATQVATQASAKADQALADADAAKAAAAHPAVPDAVKWAANTQLSGKVYYNFSTITQKSNGVNTPVTGTGFNLKRVYLTVDHQFSKVFSATVTTDVSNVIGETANTNYAAPAANTTTGAISSQGEVGKGLYLKFAYGQAKIDPALVIRLGAAPLPWVPYEESIEGHRHIEDTFVDRIKVGTSSDWGVHVLGDLAGGLISYQISAVDGAGYRNVKVSRQIDFEGRLSAQYKGLFAAVGGYTGRLGNNTEDAAEPVIHTAQRYTIAAGYKNKLFTVGGEYVYAKNYNSVVLRTVDGSPDQDSNLGYSVFGTVNVTSKWSVFGRYDWLRDIPSFNHALSEDNRITDHYLNAGIQWEPVKIFDLALVYKHEAVDNGELSTYNGTIGGSLGSNGTYDEFGLFGQIKF